MKMSRKILCLVLALVMVMGLAVTAMAEEETPATAEIEAAAPQVRQVIHRQFAHGAQFAPVARFAQHAGGGEAAPVGDRGGRARPGPRPRRDGSAGRGALIRRHLLRA